MKSNDATMGIAKAVYVKDDDLPLWQRATAYARRQRLTMSALILLALEDYLERHGAGPPGRG